jgi:hypothetical protein
MKRRILPPLGLIVLLLALFARTYSAQALPPIQVVQFSTPTPGPDGRIIYIVQPGDNCISISLKTGVPLNLLYAQNPQLNTDCSNLRDGMELLLGLGGPAAFTPTPGPSPTATLPPPTATPFTGTTEICVLLYDDINGDSLRQDNEFGLLGGQVSVTDINGAYTNTQATTNAADPNDATAPERTCFRDVPQGTYNITVAVPENYNPTTTINYRLDVSQGDLAFVDFGAQSNTEQVPDVNQQTDTGGGNSPMLGIVGGLLLLGGLGIGWYALRTRTAPPKLGGR